MAALISAIALSIGVPNPALSPDWAPEAMPEVRCHGLAKIGSKWVFGGLRGLWVGTPGRWENISSDTVKTVAVQKGSVWVLFGHGGVDRLDLNENRHYYDVLSEAVKRPWSSSLEITNQGLVFGGLGGWVTKNPKELGELYPAEMAKQVVTCTLQGRETTWIGTQNGLFQVSGRMVKRLGFAAGLKDVWITALAHDGEGVLVGTASGGLLRISSARRHQDGTQGSFQSVSGSPTRIRSLLIWKGRLVVGALDGAHVHAKSGWKQLTTSEATMLSEVDGRLYIGTPDSGIRVFRTLEQ